MPPLPRPNPSRGVFETMLVVAGRPVELEGHLARLATSLERLYGADLPGNARELSRAAAVDLPLGRLRLTVVPAACRLTCDINVEAVDPALPFPAHDRGATLSSLHLEGGLGEHKWVDRPPALTGSEETVPLLTEVDGEVLEAGRANVFAARDKVLVTPPTDGRILPGIARAAAIAIARRLGVEVREQRLDREDLLTADEVFLTNSVRGVEPARSLDGTPLSAKAAISGAIVAALRRRWRLRSAPVAGPMPEIWQRLGPLAH